MCPGLHQKLHGQQTKGGDCPPLFCSTETHLECCVLFWGPQHSKDFELLERALGRAIKLITQNSLLLYLEERRLQGYLKAAFQDLKRGPRRKLGSFSQGYGVIGQGKMALN